MIDVTAFPDDSFTYAYLAGPTSTKEKLDTEITEGNCRLALQLYFYKIHNVFITRDEILLPRGYRNLGEFIFQEEDVYFEQLKTGDVIFAQNLKNKNGEFVNRGREDYQDEDEWLYHLHSAIFLGKIDPDSDNQYIWHATSIAGGSVLWNINTFIEHYIPITVKRFL